MRCLLILRGAIISYTSIFESQESRTSNCPIGHSPRRYLGGLPEALLLFYDGPTTRMHCCSSTNCIQHCSTCLARQADTAHRGMPAIANAFSRASLHTTRDFSPGGPKMPFDPSSPFHLYFRIAPKLHLSHTATKKKRSTPHISSLMVPFGNNFSLKKSL